LAGKDYYLTPDGASGQKAYALLRQALLDGGLCAVAQAVWHGKQQLAVLSAGGRLIVMSLLKYASELKAPSVFEPEVAEVAEFTAEELQLTQTLVQATAARQFDFSQYTNQYQERLAELIEAKVAGRELVAAEVEQPQVVINLMDALRASVAKARKAAGQQGAKRPSRTTRKATVAKRKPAASAGQRKTPSRKKKLG
jgi:DNA end-binding protein Ku